ncbi:cell division protein FtsQ [Photobacterium kishitanii]|uniref:Cell division protein FtsQ n=1 Tax=Photobacterium kishitanii TaxID=318456 RepID=A0AAX0YX18_9GAMM|nr:cell division protein FtsQ/DivIB [Photobacterium kishitanii]KJG10476.1 cell division protein FtsQ [Photobacterium kishitanii]KJG57748.1 cell division protein FtsQ [Photobacterium kishitanii]KJG61363.1 cell division protein FtsQ [Photobacterium kishitanii]KJG65557.1 cell division protein FtsQ [Photobacterium kishitanii]KJG70394.1 cell division protein FtsQ [Photobacterium kishitanii]
MTEQVVNKEHISSSPRGLKRWGGLAFFIFVIGFTVWLVSATKDWMTDANRLPLSNLVIQGQLHYLTKDDVRQSILNLHHLGTFMTQDVNSIQASVEALPWVAQAAVRKQWPNTIKVFLVENQPIAEWNGTYLVNRAGDVFKAPALQVAGLGLTNLIGPKGTSQEVLAGLREMRPVLKKAGFGIASLAFNERRSWRVVLKNGIILQLGHEARMQRIKRFIEIYPELLKQDKPIDYVDLRYDSGAAVGWKTKSEYDNHASTKNKSVH